MTNQLLPNGNLKDLLDFYQKGLYKVSIVGAANLLVFILAESLGIKGTENIWPASSWL